MKFFGAKSAPKKDESTVKNSVINMKETLELLDKREKMLQSRIDKEVQVAKQNATKNKTVALAALKRKKAMETQLNNLSQMRFNLEMQLSQIEAASMNRQVLDSMSAGAKALKHLHGNLDSAKVEETMDEIQDQFDIAEDLTAALTRQVGVGQYIDEDDLMAELEELESQSVEAGLLNVDTPMDLPAAPTHEPVVQEEDQEAAELAALQRAMMA